jgi:hypothetical protein
MQRRKLGSSAWKRTFSACDVASSIATGQVTSDSLKYPRHQHLADTLRLCLARKFNDKQIGQRESSTRSDRIGSGGGLCRRPP